MLQYSPQVGPALPGLKYDIFWKLEIIVFAEKLLSTEKKNL